MQRPVGNILIVEDDPDTRLMIAAMLSSEGFHVISAEDGLEALHLLRAVRHRMPGLPCLVLLDLKMPRLGGSEFRNAQLRDPELSQVPVAVVSGSDDLARYAEELGAVATVTKPVDVNALLDVVHRHCA